MNNVPADDSTGDQAPFELGANSESTELNERWPRAVHYWWWVVCLWICSVDSYFQFQEVGFILAGSALIPDRVVLTSVVLTTVSSSMLLFGLGLFAVRRMRRIKYPQYEGECLLLAAGVHFAAYIVLHSLPTVFWGPDASFLDGRPQPAIFVVVPILSAWAMIVAWRRAEKAWRIFIIVYSAMSLLLCLNIQGFASSLQHLTVPLDDLASLYLIGLASMDIIKKRIVPWTHWLGIVAYLWQETAGNLYRLYLSTFLPIQSNWPF